MIIAKPGVWFIVLICFLFLCISLFFSVNLYDISNQFQESPPKIYDNVQQTIAFPPTSLLSLQAQLFFVIWHGTLKLWRRLSFIHSKIFVKQATQAYVIHFDGMPEMNKAAMGMRWLSSDKLFTRIINSVSHLRNSKVLLAWYQSQFPRWYIVLVNVYTIVYVQIDRRFCNSLF